MSSVLATRGGRRLPCQAPEAAGKLEDSAVQDQPSSSVARETSRGGSLFTAEHLGLSHKPLASDPWVEVASGGPGHLHLNEPCVWVSLNRPPSRPEPAPCSSMADHRRAHRPVLAAVADPLSWGCGDKGEAALGLCSPGGPGSPSSSLSCCRRGQSTPPGGCTEELGSVRCHRPFLSWA